LIIGFLNRIAAIPLFIIMMTAIITTKIPILIIRDSGQWHMNHGQIAMSLLILFIFIYGAGRLSLDYLIQRRMTPNNSNLSGPDWSINKRKDYIRNNFINRISILLSCSLVI